jgi:hypothetical protein
MARSVFNAATAALAGTCSRSSVPPADGCVHGWSAESQMPLYTPGLPSGEPELLVEVAVDSQP